MKSVLTWVYPKPVHMSRIKKQPINAIEYKPDGTQILVATGSKIYMFDANLGEGCKKLKGPKDTVYCLAYAADGKRFASGGADKHVIIWSAAGEGELKYPHMDSILCLAYNPITQQLASCTASDFGLWSREQVEVTKLKVNSKILCCSWTNDGQHLALGHFDGTISIRDKEGVEKLKITDLKEPVWTMSWNPSRDEPYDVLAVGCWDQTLNFYHLSGKKICQRSLGFDPCSISYFNNGEYMVIAGSNKKATLWKKEGIKICDICETSNWIWSAKPRPNDNFVAVGTEDGDLKVYHLMFSTVHGLHEDQYAYRSFMTDVVVQDLVSENTMRIRCKDYVKRIAVYKGRLAVQLPERVYIYDIFYDESEALMQFHIRSRIHKKIECNLLVVTSQHIILCHEMKLQLFNFKGTKEREWTMDSVIRYIKVIGGPPNREALLVGLRNGSVCKIFIDNPFPIQLLKHTSAIRCLDLSLNRDKLALVDERGCCSVYNLKTKQYTFQERPANAVAWNSSYDDMLCYSGNNVLNMKTADFPIFQHKFKGFVVGFKGSKVFGLHFVNMSTIDIPQSASLHRFIQKEDFKSAYKVACLGVTETDWKLLAFHALMGMDFKVARNAFIRIRDYKYIDLLNKFERQLIAKNYDKNTFMAEIFAYQGKFEEAADKFIAAKNPKAAIDMLCDLHQWDKAKQIAQRVGKETGINMNDLIHKQATLAEEDGDLKTAAELYMACGETRKSIRINGDNKWFKPLFEIMNGLDIDRERELILMCSKYFLDANQITEATAGFEKLNDFESLVDLYIKANNWEQAFKLRDTHPHLSKKINLPYARWLAENDKFDQSMQAFIDAGEPEEAIKMIELLSHNAVTENRFKDASYYFWLLARKSLDMATAGPRKDMRRISQFMRFRKLSHLYYAYESIYQYSVQPFNSVSSNYLFNRSRFLLMTMKGSGPYGISKVFIVLALARLSYMLGNFELAREAYQRLSLLRIPSHLRDEVDLASININSKPMTNHEEMIPICYRCGSANPLLHSADRCSVCQHPFIRSFTSFEHLPLVEFTLPKDVSPEEAEKLINLESIGSMGGSSMSGGDGWKESSDGGAERLSLGAPQQAPAQSGGSSLSSDVFSQYLISMDHRSDRYRPVQVTTEMLKQFNRDDVFIVDWNSPAVPRQYFKCLVEGNRISHCTSCNSFFQTEDFEFLLLKSNNKCPICRHKYKVQSAH